jgi:hypothetical protein
MIRYLLPFYLGLLSLSAGALDNTPDSKMGSEVGLDVHVLVPRKRFIGLVEARTRSELTDESYRQLMMGTYYRVTKRWRVGYFAQFEQGLRWDEFWDSSNGKWGWKKRESGQDFSSVLDATYNDQIKGSARWLWESKTRLVHYHGRARTLAKQRFGVKYFDFEEGAPRWQHYSYLEGYFPLDYGKQALYEYWLYAGTLYHWDSQLSVGPYMAFRQRFFKAYDSFSDRTGKHYSTTFTSAFLGLSMVYQFK